MRKFLLFILIFSPVFIQAQYTGIINSNRPGFSESPYSVGTGVYQFETSLFLRKAPSIPIFSNPQAFGLNLDFRTSFFDDRLELNLSTALQKDKIAFKNVFESSYEKIGFGKATLAAKYLIYEAKYTKKGKEIRSWRKRHGFDQKRLIPNVAVYTGANFGSFLNAPHRRGGTTAKFGVLLQNEFSKQYNLVTNVYYNYIGSDQRELSYIITATYNFKSRLSGFLEHQALFNKQEKQSNVGGGFAYLLTRDLQINSSVRATFQEQALGFYSSIGASYRIDTYYDKFIEKDEFGNNIEEEEEATYNKGFFGRMLDKIKGLFKGKKEIDTDIDTEEGKNKDKNNGRKRKKSVLGDIIKTNKKAKKAKLKEEKRALKKAEKAKRKEERKKEKEEKRKLKEEEKLANEIKELEEELKKEELKKEEEELQKKYKEELRKKKEAEEKKDDDG